MIEERRGRLWCWLRHVAAAIALMVCGAVASGSAWAQIGIKDVRVARLQELARVAIATTEAVQPQAYVLGAPYRLVIDLPPVDWQLGREARLNRPPITAWRFGRINQEVMRVVFDLDRPVRIQKALALPPTERVQDWQFIVDLEPVSKDEFDRLLREQRGQLPDYTAPGEEAGEEPRAGRDAPLIVIDPGHGGIDPGAMGKNGTSEKDIVLLVARDLREKIRSGGRYRVLLTRGADHYVALRQRFEIARSAGADIFLSLHADSSPLRASRGLSVYTLSSRASDAEAAALARRENRADVVAGVDLSRNGDKVAGILIDLAQRRSLHDAHRLAANIVAALRGKVEMVPRPQRAAGFAVLKAPDVPSVLIELGHLSNPKEEHLLRDPAYRSHLAVGLLAAIDRYFAANVKRRPIRAGAAADAERP